MMSIDRATKMLKEKHEYLIQLLGQMPTIKQVLKEFDGKVINKRLRNKLYEATTIVFYETNDYYYYYLEAYIDYQFRFNVLRCDNILEISSMTKGGNYRLDYSKAEKIFNKRLEELKKEKEEIEYSIEHYENVYKKVSELKKEMDKLKEGLHVSVRY